MNKCFMKRCFFNVKYNFVDFIRRLSVGYILFNKNWEYI